MLFKKLIHLNDCLRLKLRENRDFAIVILSLYPQVIGAISVIDSESY